MLLSLLASLAFAGPPPGVDLEDYSAWAQASDALLDGPPGCYEVVGRATWAWDLGRFGYNRGDAVIVGRLHDGVWSGLRALTIGEVEREGRKPERRAYSDEMRVVPMLGRVEQSGRRRGSSGRDKGDDSAAPTGSTEAVNLVRRALDEISGEVEVAWATWEPTADAVVLHRQMEIGGGRALTSATVRTRFPQGRAAPDGLEVVFPDKWRTDSFPAATITDASVQVRGQVHDGVAFPRSEAVRMTASVLGFTFAGAQTIAYRSIVPCDEAARRDQADAPAQADPTDGVAPSDAPGGDPAEVPLAIPEVGEATASPAPVGEGAEPTP